MLFLTFPLGTGHLFLKKRIAISAFKALRFLKYCYVSIVALLPCSSLRG
nr:MAG TPA: hypothetical protein [Bacteriophage sp.]